MRIVCLICYFWKSSTIWNFRLVRITGGALRVKKTSTNTFCLWPLLGVESRKVLRHVRHCYWTSPNMNEPYAQWCWASYDQLTCYTITNCRGKREAVFAIAITAGDSINYQSIDFGSFAWENHVRYWITVIYLREVLGAWVNFPDPDVWIKYMYISKALTVYKIFSREGISSDIRSEIEFYGDMWAEP